MLGIRAEEQLPFVVEAMELDDIPAVMDVERQSFSMPWPAHAYRRELRENRLARYIVARWTGENIVPAPSPSSDPLSRQQPARQRGWRGLLDRLAGALAGESSGTEGADARSRRVAGYAGLWLMVDEAHVTSIAVAPAFRGLGAGELLFIALIDISRAIGAQYMTLEVRVSNALAQSLYRKYRFKETGVRRKYYSDNNEDALIMWSDPLDSPAFRQLVEEHRRALVDRMRSPRTVAELRSRAAQA